MIQSISSIYKKHTILVKKFSPYTFYTNDLSKAIMYANNEGIKTINMKLFVPERVCFIFGLTLGRQQNMIDLVSPFKTVCTGLLGNFMGIGIYTDVFSEDKLEEKEYIEMKAF